MHSERPIRLNGWTGGQYSVYRAAMGLLLAAGWVQSWLTVADTPTASGICSMGLAASGMIVVGWFDRAAAAACVLLGGKLMIDADRFDLDAIVVLFVLIAHVVTPPSPYGSLAARGRADARGDWLLPASVVVGAWALMVAMTTAIGLTQLYDRGLLMVMALYGPVAMVTLLRPYVWLAMTVMLVALTVIAIGAPGPFDVYDLGIWLVHALTFDPAWVRPKRQGDTDWLFYDGGCGLCHAAVRFALAEDLTDAAFRFAPLGGRAFGEQLSDPQRAGLPRSVVVLTADGRLLTRSAAVIEMLGRLGGAWRIVGGLMRIVPRPLRDAGYRTVAQLRRKLFVQPTDACPVIAERDRDRFVV